MNLLTYDEGKSILLRAHFPQNCRTWLDILARKESSDVDAQAEVKQFPKKILIVNGDTVARNKFGRTPASMDFAFAFNNSEILLSEMKFDCDRSLHSQLSQVPNKFIGSYIEFHQMGSICKTSYVLFKHKIVEEAISILRNIMDACDKPLIVHRQQKIRAIDINTFIKKFL